MADIDDTIDVHCVDDFLPTMPTVRGRVALAQRLTRRLTTRRGQIPYWPEFGYDIRDALLSKKDPQRIESDVEDECGKDEQIEAVKATLTMVGTSGDLLIQGSDADGPFEFTMPIKDAVISLGALLENG